MLRLIFNLAFIIWASLSWAQKPVLTLQVPGKADYCRIDTSGVSVIPSGRWITPAGKTWRVSNGAYGLTLAPDEKNAVVLHHNGAITLADLVKGTVERIPPYGKDSKRSAFIGAAFSTDGHRVFLS